MTDHLEQAADRCLFLALRLRSGIDLEHVAEGASQHLDYVAGLIRGGAVQPVTPGRCESHIPQLISGPDIYCDLRAGHAGRHEGDGATWSDQAAGGLTAAYEIAQQHDDPQKAAEDYRKRWHEAATQRNTIVRAARALLDVPADQPNDAEMDDLRCAVELFETREPTAGNSADRLRRELWAVLDRMPASDDDLIATVQVLKRDLDDASKAYHESVRQHEKTADVMEKAQNQRDELREAVRQLLASRFDVPGFPDVNAGSSVVRPEHLDRLAELVKEQQ